MIKLDKSFLIKLILADIAMILLHILFAPQYSFFNLDLESNFPTVYQGLKLIGIGVLILCFMGRFFLSRWEKYSVMITSAFFIFLGADEMAHVHENSPMYIQQMFPGIANFVETWAQNIGYGGALWVIYFLPIFLFMIGVWSTQLVWFAWYKKQNIMLILAAILLILTVPGIEWINTSSGFSPLVYERWIILEESVELFGISLLGYGYVRLYESVFRDKPQKKYNKLGELENDSL